MAEVVGPELQLEAVGRRPPRRRHHAGVVDQEVEPPAVRAAPGEARTEARLARSSRRPRPAAGTGGARSPRRPSPFSRSRQASTTSAPARASSRAVDQPEAAVGARDHCRPARSGSGSGPRSTARSSPHPPLVFEAPSRRTVPSSAASSLLFALISPRLALFALWIFSDMLSHAFDSWVVPFLGFFLLPWTTLAYAVMWSVGATVSTASSGSSWSSPSSSTSAPMPRAGAAGAHGQARREKAPVARRAHLFDREGGPHVALCR